MVYEGRCICENIKVSLKDQPKNCVRCHCRNCSRSGGGSSLNYVVKVDDVSIHDPKVCARNFKDCNTVTGEPVQREFCGNCGSPIVTWSPQFPGQALIKASLFDVISAPGMEVFTHRRQKWETPIAGANQA